MHLHDRVLLRVLVHPVRSRQAGSAPDPLSVQPVRNGPEPPPALALLPAALGPEGPATPWSWLGNQFAVMAAATAVMQAGPAVDSAAALLAIGLPCHQVCANRSHLVSSCSCRSLRVVRRFLHHVVLMEPPSALVVMVPRPHHPPLGRPLRLRPMHRDDPDSVRAQAQAASAVPVVPTGMTAPSWKHSATARHRSSARRFTSSVRTMIHSQRKPVGSLASRRTWSCRRAWLVLPSPSRSKEPHRNRWQRCASVARKRHVSVNVAEPWNCEQHAKPNRYVQK